MLSTPEGRAWGILLTAFGIFGVLVVTIPIAIRWRVIHATEAQEVFLKPIDGAVDVKGPGETDFISIAQSRDIPKESVEGAVIATDEHRAFLRLFEQSTLTLYNGTQILLSRVRSPKYAASSRPNEIEIQIERGRVVIGVAPPVPPLERTLHMRVKTPQADLTLEEGSYSVIVDEAQTQVTVVRPGGVTIGAGEEEGPFRSGRFRIATGSPIEGPLPPEQDLIVNGGFLSMLERGWEMSPSQRQDRSDPFGEVEIAAEDGKTMLSFHRRGARTHGEDSVIQRIDKGVRDFTSLRLSCEVLVRYQSLAGGGYESTEFPVMVELRYEDTYGNQRSRYWGFYYKDPGAGPEWRTMVNGNKVIQGEWYLFESQNLMQSMGDTRPVHIDSLRIYASGWDWESALTNVALLVQE